MGLCVTHHTKYTQIVLTFHIAVAPSPKKSNSKHFNYYSREEKKDDENKKKYPKKNSRKPNKFEHTHISKTFVIFNIQLLLKSNKLLSNIEHDE